MAIKKYKNTLMISMAVVTKGPVATAGSILSFAKAMGTKEPTNAATAIELTTAPPFAPEETKPLPTLTASPELTEAWT